MNLPPYPDKDWVPVKLSSSYNYCDECGDASDSRRVERMHHNLRISTSMWLLPSLHCGALSHEGNIEIVSGAFLNTLDIVCTDYPSACEQRSAASEATYF